MFRYVVGVPAEPYALNKCFQYFTVLFSHISHVFNEFPSQTAEPLRRSCWTPAGPRPQPRCAPAGPRLDPGCTPTDPPLRIQVFVKKLYADQDYDDGHLLGGAADIIMWSKVEHESHGETYQSQEIEWNMDDGFFSPTPTSVEIYGIEPGGEEWVREVFEYDMDSLEIYDHIECTPRTDVYYSYITWEDDNWGYQFWLDFWAGILGMGSGLTMTMQGAVAVWMLGMPAAAVMPPAGAAVAAIGALEVRELHDGDQRVGRPLDGVVLREGHAEALRVGAVARRERGAAGAALGGDGDDLVAVAARAGEVSDEETADERDHDRDDC